MTRYLIHNVYGDAQNLIDTAPDDVVCVPFGWTEEVEEARNALFSQLNVSGVSCLPAVLFLSEERVLNYVDEQGNPQSKTIPQQWREARVADLVKPWTWDLVNLAQASVEDQAHAAKIFSDQ